MNVKFIKTGFEMFTVVVETERHTLEKERVHLSNRYEVAEELKEEIKNMTKGE